MVSSAHAQRASVPPAWRRGGASRRLPSIGRTAIGPAARHGLRIGRWQAKGGQPGPRNPADCHTGSGRLPSSRPGRACTCFGCGLRPRPPRRCLAAAESTGRRTLPALEPTELNAWTDSSMASVQASLPQRPWMHEGIQPPWAWPHRTALPGVVRDHTRSSPGRTLPVSISMTGATASWRSPERRFSSFGGRSRPSGCFDVTAPVP